MTGGVHGTHAPSRRYYEIRSMSGRYASYWNAFLFSFISTGTKTYLSTPTHSFETHVYLHWDRCPCFGFRTYVLVSLLPPANIACEGYVFTCVFQSFCSQLGGGACMPCVRPAMHVPPPCMPPTMHAPSAMHAPYHACPLPHMPPATHAPIPHMLPYHTCPPTTHAPTPCHAYPLPRMPPPCHACPLPHMPPCHACPPATHVPPTLRHAVNERAVCILLECILVYLLVLIVYLLMIPQKRQLFYVIVN